MRPCQAQDPLCSEPCNTHTLPSRRTSRPGFYIHRECPARAADRIVLGSCQASRNTGHAYSTRLGMKWPLCLPGHTDSSLPSRTDQVVSVEVVDFAAIILLSAQPKSALVLTSVKISESGRAISVSESKTIQRMLEKTPPMTSTVSYLQSLEVR